MLNGDRTTSDDPSTNHSTVNQSHPRQAQCKVFNTVFNPTGARLGTKVLRERLKGPSVASYYPRRIGTFNDLAKLYPEWEGLDVVEWDRQEKVAAYVIPLLIWRTGYMWMKKDGVGRMNGMIQDWRWMKV